MVAFVEEPLFVNWRTGEPISINDRGLVPWTNVVIQFGAKGDGLTASEYINDAAFQAAADYINDNGGGVLYVPPGNYYRTDGTALGSNTRVVMDPGAVLIADGPNWHTETSVSHAFFTNKNYNASALTDHDISIVGGGKFDYNGFVLGGGGLHAIEMRYVDNVLVQDMNGEDGENLTAMLACRNTRIISCNALNMSNCYFDHWDGAGEALVAFCTGRNTGGKNINQGIQFTGAATDLSARTSSKCKVIGNSLFGVRTATGFASAIIANVGGVASVVTDFISGFNWIEDSDLGLVYDGLNGTLSRCRSNFDTFKQVTKQPIFARGTSSYIDVNDPLFIDCNANSGVGLVDIAGDTIKILGILLRNTGAIAYEYIVSVSGATGAVIEIHQAANSGTIGRVLITGGVTPRIEDWGAWNTFFTPVVTAGTGAFTTVAATCRHIMRGKTCHFDIQVAITTNGTAATDVRVTLPIAARTTNESFGVGRDSTSGTRLFWGTYVSGNFVTITTDAGVYPGADGRNLCISGTYETA